MQGDFDLLENKLKVRPGDDCGVAQSEMFKVTDPGPPDCFKLVKVTRLFNKLTYCSLANDQWHTSSQYPAFIGTEFDVRT